jgi:DNA-binding MarR family transcriptional regulator
MAAERAMPSTLRVALQRYLDARHAALTEARRALRVNELDARALLYVADHPGCRPGNLRHYLGITAAGVTTLVDRLVERDAIRRDVDEHDRRVNRLSLTVDLRTEPWSALTRFDDQFEAAIAASDPESANRLAEALDALTDAVTSARA